MEASIGDHQGPERFQMNELTGAPPRPKQYPPRTGRSIPQDHIQWSSTHFILHTNN